MIADLLTKDEVIQVEIKCGDMMQKNKSWRYGQAFFNALHTLFPDQANEIRGTQYDPFYIDSRVEQCIKFITS